MTSTELKIGLNDNARSSSRVLKPPGGGHTNIFGEIDPHVPKARSKYNQQNSSNMNACINPEEKVKVVDKVPEDSTNTFATIPVVEMSAPEANKTPTPDVSSSSNKNQQSKGKVPPGGFSSGGFW